MIHERWYEKTPPFSALLVAGKTVYLGQFPPIFGSWRLLEMGD